MFGFLVGWRVHRNIGWWRRSLLGLNMTSKFFSYECIQFSEWWCILTPIIYTKLSRTCLLTWTSGRSTRCDRGLRCVSNDCTHGRLKLNWRFRIKLPERAKASLNVCRSLFSFAIGAGSARLKRLKVKLWWVGDRREFDWDPELLPVLLGSGKRCLEDQFVDEGLPTNRFFPQMNATNSSLRIVPRFLELSHPSISLFLLWIPNWTASSVILFWDSWQSFMRAVTLPAADWKGSHNETPWWRSVYVISDKRYGDEWKRTFI